MFKNKANREPMAKVDRAWLRMEHPNNLMMITGVIGLADAMDFQRLTETLESRLLSFRRFRQIAVDRSDQTYWEYDPDFRIEDHLMRVALPGDAGREELQRFVSELASQPLNQSKPLWQFHLVENHQAGPVLISRIHHCIADGIALVQVLLSLTDPSPEPRPSSRDPGTWTRKRSEEAPVFKRLLQPARSGANKLIGLGKWALVESAELVQDPKQVTELLDSGVEIGNELLTVSTLSDDPDTPLKGELNVKKQVAWTDPVPLDEVKAISRALSCTVNDVLVAAVTGALHRYLLERGEVMDEGMEIRATVPVNLRPLEHAAQLGNQFGLVYLSLPVGDPNPLRRLYKINQAMNELKASKQAAVAFGLLAALGMGPAVLQKPALDIFSRKASAVLTNVPGPQQPLYIAGARMRDMMFWVPQNGTIGVGISILSYNGKVFFGLIADRLRVPEPQAIIRHFGREFEILLYSALFQPVDERPCPNATEALLAEAIERLKVDW